MIYVKYGNRHFSFPVISHIRRSNNIDLYVVKQDIGLIHMGYSGSSIVSYSF